MKHRARKRFGQNFLQDQVIINAIVATLNPDRQDRVLEIGPGLGALTDPLLEKLEKLTVVELDRDLVERLEQRHDSSRLSIISDDILNVSLAALTASVQPATAARYRLIGNLPYNISTPLLFHLLKQREFIQDMHFMLQKEVADRLCASVNTRDYGRLSVMMQHYFNIDTVIDVPPESFSPAPKVQSSVVRLVPLSGQKCDFTALETVVRMAFGMRRKTLRNNFRPLFDEAKLRALSIDPTMRAETLSVEDYVRLADSVATNLLPQNSAH